MDERSLLAKMGTDDFDVHFNLVRRIERRVVWISRERDRPIRGPHGVSLSHRHWNWVSPNIFRRLGVRANVIDPEGSTQPVAWRARKAQES